MHIVHLYVQNYFPYQLLSMTSNAYVWKESLPLLIQQSKEKSETKRKLAAIYFYCEHDGFAIAFLPSFLVTTYKNMCFRGGTYSNIKTDLLLT